MRGHGITLLNVAVILVSGLAPSIAAAESVSIRDTTLAGEPEDQGGYIYNDGASIWASAGIVLRDVPVSGPLSEVQLAVVGEYGIPEVVFGEYFTDVSEFADLQYDLVVWRTLYDTPDSYELDPRGFLAETYPLNDALGNSLVGVEDFGTISNDRTAFLLSADLTPLGIDVAAGDDLVVAIRQYAPELDAFLVPLVVDTGGPEDGFLNDHLSRGGYTTPYLFETAGLPGYQWAASVSVVVPEPISFWMQGAGIGTLLWATRWSSNRARRTR